MTKILERRSPKRATKPNPHTGSSFDEYLVEEGIFEEVQAKALKRALAEQLEEAMVAAKLTKIRMAEQMKTSRSQLDRVLDPDNVSIQLDTLIKAARALGKTVEIKISKGAKPAFQSDGTSLGVVGVAGAGRTRRSGLSKLPRLLGRNKTWPVPE